MLSRGRGIKAAIAMGAILICGAAAQVSWADLASIAAAEPTTPLSPISLGGAIGQPAFTPLAGGAAATPEAQKQLQDSGEATLQAEREMKQLVNSPAGADDRRRSREAFRSLSDLEAVATLKSTFADQLRPQAPDAETLFDGAPVVDWRGDNVAVLAAANGEPTRLVDAPMALRVDDPNDLDATKRPTDLDIVGSSPGHLRAASGAADIELPKSSRAGIDVGDIHVTPNGSADATRMDSDTMTYPNIATDTDLAVNLTQGGLETFHQLRGPDAPDTQSFRFDLPPDAHLELATGGGAHVVRDSQELVAISKPRAEDAQGTEVGTSFDVDGDLLTIHVDHRNRSLAYPILMDPTFTVKDDWGCSTGNPSPCNATWFHGYQPALNGLAFWGADSQWSGYAMSKQCYWGTSWNNCYGYGAGGGPNWNPGSGQNTGLHVWAGFNNGYAPGAYAQYVYQPPGSTTQIFRADMGAKFIKERGNTSTLEMFHGIYSYPAGNYAGSKPQTFADDMSHGWHADFGSSVPGPQALTFGVRNAGGNIQPGPTDYFSAYLGASVIQLTDPDVPTLAGSVRTGDGSSAENRWLTSGAITFDGTAADNGLGVRSLSTSVSGSGYGSRFGSSWSSACGGGRSDPCPGTWTSAPTTVNVLALDEGNVPVTFKATDALGKASPSVTKTLKIDNADPVVDVDGPLNPEDRPWVGAGKQSVYVSADDTGSGVVSIAATIDSTPIGTSASQTCPQYACSLTREVVLDTDDIDPNTTGSQPLSEGSHIVTIEVKDAAGRRTVKSWTIRHDRTAPTLQVSGSLKDAQGQMLAPNTAYSVNNTATDSATNASGMGQIEINVDDAEDEGAAEQRCVGGGCALTRDFSYQSSAYSPGPHQVEVVAIDEAGNRSSETVTVNQPNDSGPPCPLPTPATTAGATPATPQAALDSLGSAAGVPEAVRPSQLLDLGPTGSLIQPALSLQGSTIAFTQSFATGAISSTSSQGAAPRIETPEGPLCLMPTQVSDGASQPLLSSGNGVAMFANALPATDYAFRVTATGVQMLTQLRSAAAPQTSSWSVQLPEDETLKTLPDGSVAVIRLAEPDTAVPPLSDPAPAAESAANQQSAIGRPTDEISQSVGSLQRAENLAGADEVLAVFRVPWAKDAQGQAVPVTLSSADRTITMSTAYKGNSYPVVASTNGDSAAAADRGSNAKPEADSPERDDTDDSAFEASEPQPSGSAPAITSDTASGEDASDSVGDYADYGSAGGASGIYDDASETPPGAAAPDATSSDESAASAASLTSLQIGLSESNVGALVNPRLRELAAKNPGGKQYLRVFVPWNYMAIRANVLDGSDKRPCAVRAVRAWEGSTKNTGYREIASHLPNTETMVVFSSNIYKCDQAARDTATYKKEIKRFLDVRENAFVQRISPFNEPNYYRGLKRSPERAAEYWKAARDLCTRKAIYGDTSRDRCGAVPAGDFAMAPGTFTRNKKQANYVDLYSRQIRASPPTKRPVIWAFHPWADTRGYSAGRTATARTSRFNNRFRLRYSDPAFNYKKGNDAKRPAIWDTEVGAQYRMSCADIKSGSLRDARCGDSKILFFGQKLQVKTAAFLLRASLRNYKNTTKVARLYYYNFQDGTGPDVGTGYAGRCTGKSRLSCPPTDSGLFGIDSNFSYTAQDSTVKTFPGSDPAHTSSPSRQPRLVWCLLRDRVPFAVKYGRVTTCG